MDWKTAQKYYRKKDKQPKISISPKTNTIYFNKYIKDYIFGNRRRVIIRYDDLSKTMSFQPVNNGNESYSLESKGNHHTGLLLYAGNILYQFKIEVKEHSTFIPHWDSNMEWLTINMDGGS